MTVETGATPEAAPGITLDAPAATPAAQTPTPAPTPTTAPAPTPAPTPTSETITTVVYDPTGDAGLDVALAFVGKLGIGMDHPAMQATATGDFSLIKAHLATLGDKATGYEQMVALAEQAHARVSADKQAKADASAKAVHSVAGSEEQWNAVLEWAKGEATPEEKAELNAMFDAGPIQARAAAMILCDLYGKAQGTIVTPQPAVTNASAATQAAAQSALTAKELATEVNALARRVGSHNLHNHPEYAALHKRFRAN